MGSGSGSIYSSINKIDLQKSLSDAGFKVNNYATNFYKKASGGRTIGTDAWRGNSEFTVGETPINQVLSDQDLLNSFEEYNDLAIQVITRQGSEGVDMLTIDATDSTKFGISTKHSLELSDNEEALYNELCSRFDKVLILINSSNIFECEKFQNDAKCAGILWIGNPGDVGLSAVGKILCGDVNPSGRTVNTWTRDFTKDPSFQNFGDNNQFGGLIDNEKQKHAAINTMFNADGTPMREYAVDKSYTDTSAPKYVNQEEKMVASTIESARPAGYLSYEEGIYADYRYYETKYADLASINKKQADEWYESEEGVLYPFGYGLSYTNFKQEISSSSLDNAEISSVEDLVRFGVTVKVENIGAFAGKDAVQLYLRTPYKIGQIEKADHVLCDFAKTRQIEAGKSTKVTLSFDLKEFASYDFDDANKNGFKGYELEAGDYEILLMKNAHEMYDSISFKITNDIKLENDSVTGNTVENRFTDNGFFNSLPGNDDVEFTQMSRRNFGSTFPTHPSIADRMVSDRSRFEEFLTTKYDYYQFEAGNDFTITPEKALLKDNKNALRQNCGHTLKLDDMYSYDLDDDMWEQFLDEFTWNELKTFLGKYTFGSPAISSIGKKSSTEGDGMQKFNFVFWVSSPIIAATFNKELAQEQGECIGIESVLSKKNALWGYFVGVQRSPFGGRNFEHFSADPFLSGEMSANVIRRAAENGVIIHASGLVGDEQETNRFCNIAFMTEQALREIYLKPFQKVVQQGQCKAIMTSYGRLGLMEVAANYELLTEVLRNEWGFNGKVLANLGHVYNSYIDDACTENYINRIMAGCNNTFEQEDGTSKIDKQIVWDNTANGGLGAPVCAKNKNQIAWSFWKAGRECVKQHLYTYLHSNASSKFEKPSRFSKNLEIDGSKEFKINVLEILDTDIQIPNEKDVFGYKISFDEDQYIDEDIVVDGSLIKGTFKDNGLYTMDFTLTILKTDSTQVVICCDLNLFVSGVVEERENIDPTKPIEEDDNDDDDPTKPIEEDDDDNDEEGNDDDDPTKPIENEDDNQNEDDESSSTKDNEDNEEKPDDEDDADVTKPN